MRKAVVVKLLPEQCRAARGLLNWTQAELAVRAGISRSTVRDFEGERHVLHRSTMELLLRTFEEAGVELLLVGGTGVRIREPAGHAAAPEHD